MFTIKRIKPMDPELTEFRVVAVLTAQPEKMFRGELKYIKESNTVEVALDPAFENTSLREAIEMGTFCGDKATLEKFREAVVKALPEFI